MKWTEVSSISSTSLILGYDSICKVRLS
jgi:hypothetical protein